MDHVSWQPEYSVGEASLDTQHQTFFKMIDDLRDAIDSGREEIELIGTLQGMLDYLQNHFVFEEHYMEKGGYPELESHRQEHIQFSRHATELISRYLSDEHVDAYKVLDYLEQWLTQHILGTDHKYMLFFQQRDC
jgi:hemerythrin-like metal-binding protein